MNNWLLSIILALITIVLLFHIVGQVSTLYLAWKLYKEQKKKIVMTGICPDKTTAEALKSSNFQG